MIQKIKKTHVHQNKRARERERERGENIYTLRVGIKHKERRREREREKTTTNQLDSEGSTSVVDYLVEERVGETVYAPVQVEELHTVEVVVAVEVEQDNCSPDEDYNTVDVVDNPVEVEESCSIH